MCVLRETSREDGVLGTGILSMEMEQEKGKESFHIAMPAQAEAILEALNHRGFEAYIVGGCVRDSLLGRVPGDWDITTSALPGQVKSVFRRTVDTGIAHGTVTVLKGREAYEVTTYRIDGEYEDNRHPKNVVFTSNLAEDLKRRDFTINAMAYSPGTGLMDLFDGAGDLKRGLIRCVGDPTERFTEGALRMLRAIRFRAQLGFDIEEATRQALRNLAPSLVHVSKERIQTELTKLLLSDHPDYIREVFDDSMAPYVCAGFCRIRPENISIDGRVPPVRHFRWAALLRHLTEEEAGKILKELKLDNDTILRVRSLTRWWRIPVGPDEISVRKVMSQMPRRQFDDLMLFKRFSSERPETDEELSRIQELTDRIRERGDCVSLKTLALTGRDLIELGMEPGPALGEALESLLGIVLEHPEKNQKEALVQELKKDHKKST